MEVPRPAGATTGVAGGAASGGGGATSTVATAAPPAPNNLFARLATIVNSATAPPTIVNEGSRFVVVTYWWGRGNMNPNVARPCLIFYEDLLMKPVYFLNSRIRMTHKELSKPINWLTFFLSPAVGIKAFYQKQITNYLSERGVPGPGKEGYDETTYNDQWQYYFRGTMEIIHAAFSDPVVSRLLHQLMESKAMFKIAKNEREDLTAELDTANEKGKTAIKGTLKEMKYAIEQKNNLAMLEIKAALRKYIFGANAGEPPVPFLESFLQHKPRFTYDQMIANWETQCARVGCNYLAIEYPEFARRGGYQLAINAKPLFIKRALELCAPRAVLYIDGDMTINRYPPIFDMDDIDYMARGWRVDPRSSENYISGDIFVDPYVFETSGGIMYFSQTPESKRLLDLWIEQTALPTSKGKADDRIISLLFNTKELLAPMRIVQLPIEYLWLTLNYKDFVDPIVTDKIYVEHPECLTSEDTAASGGAASDRHPITYEKVIESMSKKRSENLYESVLFPTPEIANSFRPYLDYLRDEAVYSESDPELPGEQPFYVYPFGNFGPKQATYDANLAAAIAAADVFNPALSTGAFANVCFLTRAGENFTIPNILKQLSLGRTVFFNPDPVSLTPAMQTWPFRFMNRILQDPSKNRLEFVFFDNRENPLPTDERLNFRVDINNPFFIRPTAPFALEGRLPPLLTMFALLSNPEEIETVLTNNYQFLSQIRVHAADLPVQTLSNFVSLTRRRRQHGGARSTGRMNTNDAIELMYGALPKLANQKPRKTRRHRRLSRR